MHSGLSTGEWITACNFGSSAYRSCGVQGGGWRSGCESHAFESPIACSLLSKCNNRFSFFAGSHTPTPGRGSRKCGLIAHPGVWESATLPPVRTQDSEPAYPERLPHLRAPGTMSSFLHHWALFPCGSTRWPATNTVTSRRPGWEKGILPCWSVQLFASLLPCVPVNPLKHNWY